MNFHDYFGSLGGHAAPYPWQEALAVSGTCSNRLIRVPTGFGKTLGVLAAWSYNRVHRKDDRWPLRLVWCLPMRVLVDQIFSEARGALARLDLLWDESSDHDGKVGVHLLMGGADAGEWHIHPEQCAVLIGTQDMLLSRAMNRGYAAPRARWPMEFGLLNQDSLWVMDEVQLMDVGLATSAQLQAFREQDSAMSPRRCWTWWMSATLQEDWLRKSPDTTSMADGLPPSMQIPPNDRKGRLWDDVHKPFACQTVKDSKALAEVVRDAHLQSGSGANGPTLVVLNTVERATEVFTALCKFIPASLKGTDLRLVHSRFRPHERRVWRRSFLDRGACAPGTDRIIVATQVIEAGVDVSAGVLITQLAPWSSLVQRFGRCARWGGIARVIVADFGLQGGSAKPYSEAELDAAREALALLPGDVAPLHLEAFEHSHAHLLSRLYPFAPVHLLLRHELDELFDTTPDLSGADVDISRFIRSGNERDLQVFWETIDESKEPSPSLRPLRDALCPLPFVKAREWLCGKEGAGGSSRLKQGMRAWVWDWQDGRWRLVERRDLYPGQTVLVDARCGGYDYDPQSHVGKGWDPNHHDVVRPVLSEVRLMATEQCWVEGPKGDLNLSVRPSPLVAQDELADSAQDSEALSIAERWKTIATHGSETGGEARGIAEALIPELVDIFDLAGRWHDAGKAHPAFQQSMRHPTERPDRSDLAKAPDCAWPCRMNDLYLAAPGDRRLGFRHELASALALFDVLRRHDPDHPALLGPWREWLEKAGKLPNDSSAIRRPGREPVPLEQEILALDVHRFNLLAYLVCAHHGKLRLAWHAGKGDQLANDEVLRIRGVRDGEVLPPLYLPARDGRLHELPASRMNLSPAFAGLSSQTGASWTERVLDLLAAYGPFTLAWLEALLRAADQRASRSKVADPLLEDDNDRHELERRDPRLARAALAGAQAQTPAGDSPSRGPLHGDGGGSRGRGIPQKTTRPPHSATRYVETEHGILSYQELAPLLAERVALVAVAISERRFAAHSIDEFLILDLHRRICGDLIPAFAGRWRTREVQVGNHQPPGAFRVPILMRDYAADLAVRVAHASEESDEQLVETLTFAEGQLLHIHPFEDFNGRVTRLFLTEILYRLDLPIVDLATEPGAETDRYFAALRAYDRRDRGPLAEIWRRRFEKDAQP